MFATFGKISLYILLASLFLLPLGSMSLYGYALQLNAEENAKFKSIRFVEVQSWPEANARPMTDAQIVNEWAKNNDLPIKQP